MTHIVLRYGGLAGVVLAASMLLAFGFREQIGFEYGAVVGYTSMVAAFLAIYFGVRRYRDTVAGGQLSFGRALAVGLLITLVASACYVATWEFVYFRLAPNFLQEYTAYAMDKARKAGESEAAIEAQQREMAEFAAMYDNPVYNVAITFLEPLPVGLVFTLVTAGLLGRRRSPA